MKMTIIMIMTMTISMGIIMMNNTMIFHKKIMKMDFYQHKNLIKKTIKKWEQN